jgi:hypothetical protein
MSTQLTRTHMPTMDRTRRLASVSFASAPACRMGASDIDRLRDVAAVALAAE